MTGGTEDVIRDGVVVQGVKCRWYMRCFNEATRLVTHPILGEVPTCERCVGKHDMWHRARPIGDDQ